MNQDMIRKAEEALNNRSLNQALLDSLPYPAVILRQDRIIVAKNKVADEMGAELDSYCWDTLGNRASISERNKAYYELHNQLPERGIKCLFCMCDEAFNNKTDINKPVQVGESTFDTYWVPLSDEFLLHYFIEIKK